LEKRRGTSASLYWRRAGLADEVGLDTMPDAAGGEGVTGPLNRKGQSTGRPLTIILLLLLRMSINTRIRLFQRSISSTLQERAKTVSNY